jgi:BASS family bile acid:Na+ symporter
MAAGMQSSLLALALANRFFEDPVVGMPSAISVSFPLYTIKLVASLL